MVQNGAWWTFCAGSFTCFLTGCTYTFGAWSPALKDAFSYSQQQLGNLALAKDFGNFICMDAGLLTGRFGAHWTVAVGTLAMALSCWAIWASLTGEVPYVLMILIFWLFGHSMGFCDNAGISTSVRNFPQHKGSAVGLMKALEGLTAAVMGMVFYTLFDAETSLSSYPLVLAATALFVGLVATPIIACTNAPAEEHDHAVSKKFSALVVALLCYTVFCALVAYTKAYHIWTMLLAVVGLLCLFLLVLPLGPQTGPTGDNAASPLPSPAADRPNLSAAEMMKTLDFYLVFCIFVSLQGAGIMVSNNFGQIVKAIKEDPDAESGLYVTVFSIFSTSGRIFTGFGSESLKGKVNRPWFLTGSSLLMTAAMCALNLGESMLAVVAACVGFSVGSTFALQAVVVEEIFGPRDMPLKYSCCFAAAFFGSLILGDLVAASVYDSEASRQGRNVCLGYACFEVTFDVAVVCSFLSCLSSVAVALRSRSTYRKLNHGRGGGLSEATIAMNPLDFEAS